MEKESIAYFYLQKNTVAKEKCFAKAKFHSFCVERGDRLVIQAVGVPEYYVENAAAKIKRLWEKTLWHKRIDPLKYLPWKKEELTKMLVEEFRKSGAEHFFYGEETALFLGQELPEIPLFLLEEMLLQYGVRENLILIGNPNPLFESIFGNFMQKVNYLKIVCERPEAYEETAEWLYENYGIIVRFETKMEEQKKKLETLVIDMGPGQKNGRPPLNITSLPEGSIYMDMGSDGAKAKWITKKRKDIHYLSPESLLNKWCHLDTTA